MRAILPLLCLLSLTSPGNAGQSMTAQEFDDYTRGKTFFYGSEGQPYGAEEYLSNRRVLWTFLDGECQEGEWYEDNGLICFVYDEPSNPQCWSFELSDGGMTATFENDPTQTELYEMQQSPEPLNCPGPDVGV